MKLIKTRTDGVVFAIDDIDFERCNMFHWYWDRSTGYIFRSEHNRQRLHDFLLGEHDLSLEVDHVNGNKLLNTRENLRLVSHAVNLANSKRAKNHDNNIYFSFGKYRVYIGRNMKIKYIGSYKTIEEARYERDKYLYENFPETLNSVNFYKSIDPNCTFQ